VTVFPLVVIPAKAHRGGVKGMTTPCGRAMTVGGGWGWLAGGERQHNRRVSNDD
jgi:hypothetical protein